MPFLRQLYKQKPQAWGPVSAVQASIFKNADRIGIDPKKIIIAAPMWSKGSVVNYAQNLAYTTDGLWASKKGGLQNTTSGSGYFKFTIPFPTYPFTFIANMEDVTTPPVSSSYDYFVSIKSDTYTYMAHRFLLKQGNSNCFLSSCRTTDVFIEGSGIINGEHAIIGRFNQSIRELIQNGVSQGFETTSVDIYVGTTYFFYIGISLYNLVSAIWKQVLYLSQDLNPSQIAYLSDNPYFLLHRVPPVFYSVPGGAITIKTITDTVSCLDEIAQISNIFALSDTGTCLDGFSGLIAGLSVIDVGSCADSVAPAVRLTVQDTVAAIDVIQQILSGCAVTDTCAGDDNILQLFADILVSDTGGGADVITVLKELLKTVTDSVTGSDALSQIFADILVSDTGAGTDFINLLKDILKTISDTGSGTETVLVQPVSVSVQDASAALDIIGYIAVALSVSDASTIADIISTIKTKLVNVTDAGTGYDSEPTISVSVTVSDAALALDVIGQVINALAVYDTGSGLDRITKTDFDILPSGKVMVTFTIKTPGASFAMRTQKTTLNIE